MILTWIGHSCFTLEMDGYTVIFDPYEAGSVPGYNPICEWADLVLCSHNHHDHGAAETVRKRDGKESPFQIDWIDTFHDDKKGTLRGKNRIYILETQGIRVAHLGDLGCELLPEEVEKLRDMDLLMIPIGGYYTIDAKKAKDIVDLIHPGVVVPMHYRGAGFGYEVIGTIEEYVSLCDQVTVCQGSQLEIDSAKKGITYVLKAKNWAKK